MIFSRISIKDNATSAEQILSDVSTQDYALHQTVWKFFAKSEQKRDFLFKVERVSGVPVIYAVSQMRPYVPVNSAWYVEAKPYDPVFAKGDQLYFSIRVSACKKRTEASGKLKKTDIVIAKKRMLLKELPQDQLPSNQEITHKAASEWMNRQGELKGFELVDFQVTRHEWHEFEKNGQSGANQISFPTLDLDGTLRVVSPDHFKQMLFKGIGSARSFGCGLMMVKRI